jgi:hypothetical protein
LSVYIGAEEVAGAVVAGAVVVGALVTGAVVVGGLEVAGAVVVVAAGDEHAARKTITNNIRPATNLTVIPFTWTSFKK